MKLYITGSVGSGKSTLAEQISKITNIPCTHLDELVHIQCSEAPYGNIKRQDKQIDDMFYSVISQKDYIVEDNGRARFSDAMENADKIIVLDIPLITRKYRIIKRWIRQKAGIERCIYKPNLKMIKSMFRWLKNYESGKDGTKTRITQFQSKVIYLKNRKEVASFIDTVITELK